MNPIHIRSLSKLFLPLFPYFGCENYSVPFAFLGVFFVKSVERDVRGEGEVMIRRNFFQQSEIVNILLKFKERNHVYR